MTPPSPVPQADALLHEHQQAVYQRTDKMFAVLLLLQWFAGVAAALWISPRAWSGTVPSLHPHVIAAIAFGGLITALPVYLAITYSGHTVTRHVIAVSQMIFSALLIHLCGGRIETHFHIFGSLAFLACYRDWRVLVTATIVTLADHVVRGFIWPYSVYGVLSAPAWRSLEHGSWIFFEDIFLIVAIRQSVAEMRSVAEAIQAKSEVAAKLEQSQEALRNQTQILESVLTSMGDGVVVADRHSRFLVFNPAAQQILRQGQSATSAADWNSKYGLFEADTVTPFPADQLPLVRAIAGESTDRVEMYVRPKGDLDGIWISATGRPLRAADGSLLGGVVMFRDVTAAKHSEVQLQNAKRMAEFASLAKTQFLANMSHEIRTPLSSILGFTELLRRGIGSREDNELYLDTIAASGRHLSALIDDVLDLSKIEAGRMEFEQVRCSPHQIISEVLSLLRVRAQEKDLRLECTWQGDIPETILTDPARVRQLLMNLVGNAIKFTESGEVSLLAAVNWDKSDPKLAIEVRDTGIGIPPDRVERVFTPFEQADTSITRRFGGTGLGLAISRHIAQGLGGEITVESTPGEGSAFRATVSTGPLEGVRIFQEPPSEAFAPASENSPPAGCLPECDILLVEDGISNQQLIRLILEEAGARVATANNGEQGVQIATQQHFDLILMDMQMPVMDGYTATRRLRDLGCELPIIALTAHAMRRDREKCLEAGCSGYLTKPLDIDDLLRITAAALEESGVAPQLDHRVREPITSTLPLDNPRMRQIVDNFLVQLQEYVEKAQVAERESDWRRLAEIAHWLRGSGGTVGFACFTEPADRLDRAAKAGHSDEARRALEEIASLAERVVVLN